MSTLNGRDLGRLVSSQCPRLRKLVVLVKLAAECDASGISGVSLLLRKHGQARGHHPFLEKISVSQATKAYIDAPNLKKVDWRDDPYDPSRHQFAELNRHLQRLWIKETSMLRPTDEAI